MKENTYIVPAYHFYILKLPSEVSFRISFLRFAEDKLKAVKEEIEREDFFLIPYNEVDGLTTKEIKKALGLEGIFAISTIVETHPQNVKGKHTAYEKTRCIIDTVVFNSNLDSEMEIGKRMEQYIENNYANFSSEQKRIYHSFLEKYQCDGYEATMTKIKSIEQKRK